MPLMAPITVFLTGSFLVGNIGFRTTVDVLLSLDSLIMLVCPLPALAADDAVGTAGRFALPTAVDASVAFLLVATPLVFAFSTMLVRMPAAPPTGTGPVGFMGETGRAKNVFAAPDIAVGGRIGDRGMVRELAERGERIWDGGTLREAVRAGGRMASFFVRFFGFSTSSFSLSSNDTSSLLWSVKIGDIGVMVTYLGRFRGRC